MTCLTLEGTKLIFTGSSGQVLARVGTTLMAHDAAGQALGMSSWTPVQGSSAN